MRLFQTLSLLLVLAFAADSPAQVAYVLDSGLPGLSADVYLPSPSNPGGGTSPFGPFPLPASGLLGPGPFGGMTIDQTKGWVYCTDGAVITIDANPLYFPLTPPPPVPFPAPAPPLPGGLPINGMGIDSIAGILWMTDGVSVGGFTPAPPYLPVVPPFPVPFAAAGAPLTGLDFDSATGTLWACDALGGIYNFTPAGAPVGPQPVAVLPAMIPLAGLCVNESNGPGAVGIPFCSTQLPGYHICVTDGVAIYDALSPAAPVLPNPAFSGAPARGLAYSSDFQIVPGGVPLPSTGATPFVGWSKATHTGLGGANSLKLVGGPPATPTLLLYDICPIPGGMFIPLSGETLWLNPLSPSFSVVPLTTDAAGAISMPIGLGFAPAGITFCMQFAIADPLAPLGYGLTDAFQFITGLQ